MSGKWWDTTLNPGHGCTPISPGCANCWAKRTAETRLRGRFGYPTVDPFRVVLDPDKLDVIQRWRTPRRVFVWDMGDMFHEDVPDEHIHKVFAAVMGERVYHTWMILTKRPARMRSYFAALSPILRTMLRYRRLLLGVSVESPDYYWRLEDLLAIEGVAAGFFVSAEPLLAHIDLAPWLPGPHRAGKNSLSWVVVGPETGPGKRDCNPGWISYLAGQCSETGEFPRVPLWDKRANGYGREVPA